MLALHPHKLPPDKEACLRKAIYAEWATIGFMLSIVLVMYFALGSSQAMKTAWVEDLLSLIPPIAFLVSTHITRRPPDNNYPYGYQRAISIAFLCGAVAVFVVGLSLLVDGIKTVISQEHPTIGAVTVFGHTVWLGWFMFAALLYSAIPPVILAHIKLKLARQLHDKTLFADAAMNRADWLTALAAMIGVAGVGGGWWWADGVAASIIAVDIMRDGYGHVKTAVASLMNHHVMTVDGEDYETLPDDIVRELEALPWVAKAATRLRDEGHIILGEAYVVPYDDADIIDRLREAAELVQNLDWRVHEIVVTPVLQIPRPEQQAPD